MPLTWLRLGLGLGWGLGLGLGLGLGVATNHVIGEDATNHATDVAVLSLLLGVVDLVVAVADDRGVRGERAEAAEGSLVDLVHHAWLGSRLGSGQGSGLGLGLGLGLELGLGSPCVRLSCSLSFQNWTKLPLSM